MTRRRRRAIAGGVIVMLAILIAVGVSRWRETSVIRLEPIPVGSVLPVPATRPVILIVLENKNEHSVREPGVAPYLQRLISQGALSIDDQAVAHPSQPNYLALFSGDPQGVADDRPHDLTAPNLADQIEAANLTWRTFAENYPADGCFTGERASGGPDGQGDYARKHNAAISFTSISSSPARCANIQPLAAFRPDAADLSWVVPNLCHDMHDCSIAAGDAWLADFVPRILASPAFQPGGRGVLYITFDESDGGPGNNEIVTLAVGPTIKAATQTPTAHTHYSLLRTIEDGLGLPCLANACTANTLGEMFAP